jgi:hypothetical protein
LASIHAPDRKLPVHAGNAPDIHLFGSVKGSLAGRSFADASEFLKAVEVILDGIENGTLQAVFLDWMERLKECIAINPP